MNIKYVVTGLLILSLFACNDEPVKGVANSSSSNATIELNDGNFQIIGDVLLSYHSAYQRGGDFQYEYNGSETSDTLECNNSGMVTADYIGSVQQGFITTNLTYSNCDDSKGIVNGEAIAIFYFNSSYDVTGFDFTGDLKITGEDDLQGYSYLEINNMDYQSSENSQRLIEVEFSMDFDIVSDIATGSLKYYTTEKTIMNGLTLISGSYAIDGANNTSYKVEVENGVVIYTLNGESLE
ncbi:MAG: hypothetical protein HRU38_22050 [Saccharospirillaceae bacterium]|nr:hypothetical protein [Pseudomonadales bacterium]NRB81312.1 hypothetical protein [Saccharospirillaceae bacterium]